MDNRRKGSVTGRICITDGTHNKFVHETELAYYLNNGWRKGSYRYTGGTKIPCKVCGKMISKYDGKHGMCAKCMKDTGFYKNLWKDENYRNNVISSCTGLKRSEEFKKKQSEHMKEYYKNHPERRQAQGLVFSKAWKDGKHAKMTDTYGITRSIAENMMYDAFLKLFGSYYVSRNPVQGPDGRWCYPDVLLFDSVIVEYYGDYWHANPQLYQPSDTLANSTAQDIWNSDADREKRILQSVVNGYNKYMSSISSIIIIWESDTSHLKTQSDWDDYIANRFVGYDEHVSC